jgi:hypothetical protein
MAENPKTFRELLDSLKEHPKGRRITAYIGTVGFFAFPAAIGIAYYREAGFITYLALAFLFFLSSSHANYAMMPNLTQRTVRRIDYWYLGAGTIGLFLFAIQYSTQRDTTLSRVYVKVHQAGEAPLRADVDKQFAYLTGFLCDTVAREAQRSKAPCEAIKRLAPGLKPSMTPEEIVAFQERFSKEVTLAYGRLFRVDQLETIPHLFSSFSVLEIRVDEWRKHLEGAPKFQVNPRDEDTELLFGLGQWIVWPFLFAYALALRITKVTIDVFEWAK